MGEGKVPEQLRHLLFRAKLIAIVKIDGALRPIAIGYTLRRFVSKCAGSKALSELQKLFGSFQVGRGTKRGAEIAANLFVILIECNDNPEILRFT